MVEQDWRTLVRTALIDKGEQLGYDVNRSGKSVPVRAGGKELIFRPDVVWSIDDNIIYIFELDTGAYDTSQNTIFGNMLSGIVMAKQRGATFIEVVPRSPSGKKASDMAEVLKRELESLPAFHVFQIGRLVEEWNEDNAIKAVTRALRKIGIR